MMREILGFLALTVGGLLDPIALAGYVGAGVVARRLIVAFAIAVGWGIALIALVSAVATFPPVLGPGLILSKFAGGAIISGLTFWIMSKRRARRVDPGKESSAP